MQLKVCKCDSPSKGRYTLTIAGIAAALDKVRDSTLTYLSD